MPRKGVFTLVGPHEGKTMTILDKYPFVDGVFKTPAQYAPLMAMILCNYYSCALSYEGDDAPEVQGEDDLLNEDGSLAVSATRGQTEGQKMESQDLQAKLGLVAKYETDEAALAEKRAAERAVLDAQVSDTAAAPELAPEPDAENE